MTEKKIKPALLKALILLILAVLLKIIANKSRLIEAYYSETVYQYISTAMRFLFGWIPFSFGDILYVLLSISIIIKSVTQFRKRKEILTVNGFLFAITTLFSMLLKVYLLFMLLWGLNYFRSGISYQLQLKPTHYTADELKSLTKLLIEKVNEAKINSENDTVSGFNKSELFDSATNCYILAAKKYPFLHYKFNSAKQSLFASGLNYAGILGYYNPFTGEAQLNTSVPQFSQPFTACHEMAHQLGYASESEANFVGFLVAAGSNNTQFIYSAYFSLFEYANTELFSLDSAAAYYNFNKLDTLVKKDIAEYRNFFKPYENAVEPVLNIFYDNYLKANNQSMGIQSYNQVIDWLIAYRKKYGKL